jgi:xanthine phosphoribosyltransferase
VLGVGALIEKTFEGGRATLEAAGLKVEALARIVSMSDDRIVFAE